METRNAKLIITSSGGNASRGSKTYRVTLPSLWVSELGLKDGDGYLQLSFDGEKITVSKKPSIEDFIKNKKGNRLLKLEYFNFNDLCSTIIADYSENEIAVENHTENCLFLAFGKNENPSWQDYLSFLESRCVAKSRDRINDYLNALGVFSYEPLEIIKKTQGSMAEDNQWIRVTEI